MSATPQLSIPEARARLETLYVGVKPYQVSHAFRRTLKASDPSLTYGEVLPDSFYAVLSQVPREPGGAFYDLGSGSGKAGLLAALLFDFQKIVGVELVPELVDVSNAALARLSDGPATACSVEFRNQDLLETDFSDAQVVFAHSACYTPTLMSHLTRRAEMLMRSGAALVTINKTLRSPAFRKVGVAVCEMDWGPSVASTYLKV